MRYSYSPTTGLQTTSSAGSGHRPSYSTSGPPLPPRPQSYNSAPPTPQQPSFYSHSVPQSPPSYATNQQQNHTYRSQSYSSPKSPQSPPGHQSRPSNSSGYTPVNFDGPHSGGCSPEQFYGSLLDFNNRPTEIFSRLADAAFFWIDNNCEIPGLRGTGLIEPAKYAWMSSKLGAAPDACRLVEEFLPSFYETASIPVRYINTPKGQVPAVDRRGWLHMAVFEARATPQDNHQHWNKAVSLFGLIDPATNTPFPTPIPRSALPSFADAELQARYTQWQMTAIVAAQRAQTDAMVNNILNQSRARYSNPMSYLAGGAAGYGGANYLNNYGGGSGGGFGTGGGAGGGDSTGGGDHATVLDTVNTIGTLANTILGGFGGGGLGTAALGGGFGFS